MERKKRQRKPEIERDTSNLPCEIMSTILSKLPVKSLMRFKCVCKPWCALISESQFIRSHLSESIKSDRQRVICTVYKSECFYSVDYETCGNPVEEICFPIKKYRKADILCSCNGLVLLNRSRDKMFVLLNPSTRAYIKFSNPGACFYSPSAGICYDSSIDDYKVVCIGHDGKSYVYMVFACKTNSWTQIREFPYLSPHGGDIANGAPHWLVTLKIGHNFEYPREMHGGRDHNDSTAPTDNQSKDSDYNDDYEAVPSHMGISYSRRAIVYFDLVEDKFKEVQPPKWIGEGHLFRCTVIRDFLGLYISTSDMRHTDFWIMKEYGNRDSWTKLISIPRLVESTSSRYLKPVYFTKNGEIVLVVMDFGLVIYDPKEKKMRNMAHADALRYNGSLVCYAESLVLPSCDKLAKKKQQKHKEAGEMEEL